MLICILSVTIYTVKSIINQQVVTLALTPIDYSSKLGIAQPVIFIFGHECVSMHEPVPKG